MKVAIVLERLDLTRGGAEKSTWEMAGALCDAGMQVTVVAGKVVDEGLNRKDIPVRSLEVKALTRAGWWRKFVAAVRSHVGAERYDIVHSIVPLDCAEVYQPRGGSMTHIARRHAEAAVNSGRVAFKRATGWLNSGRQARIEAERALCQESDGPVVTALSRYVADQFRRDYGLKDERIELVRNGVRVEAFIDNQVHQEAVKMRQLCDPEGKLAILLYVGANFQRKGLDWLIRSAAQAMRRNPAGRDFRVMVVSPDDFTPYWQQARSLGLDGRILFMGRSARVAVLYAMADAVILPTRDDACSRVVMEGLAAGTPSITTRYNGAADFLDEGKYGIIVERCDDDEELADAILAICDRERCQNYKKRIREDELFKTVSMARHARELIALYQKIKGKSQKKKVHAR